MGRVTDEADLVLIASRALGAEPAQVLAEADVRALACVAATVAAGRRSPPGAEPLRQAAELISALVAHRPFAAGNRAVAWLGAAELLARHGMALDGQPAALERVAAAVTSGRHDPDEIVAALRPLSRPRPGRLRRTVGRWVRPGRGVRVERRWPCPVCARPLVLAARDVVGVPGPASASARFELAAHCWRQHRAHRPDGAPCDAPSTTGPGGPVPVVRGDRRHGCGDWLLALTQRAPVLLRRVDEHEYEVATVEALEPSELVGGWQRLADRSVPLGRVGAGAVALDEGAGMLDVDRLVSGCDRRIAAALGAEPAGAAV